MNLTKAATYLGRSRDEIKKLANRGDIPGTKLDNGTWVFYQKDLDIWAATHPHQTYKLDVSGEEIKSLVEGKTYTEVAEQLGVTRETITYHMRKQGILRKRGRPS